MIRVFLILWLITAGCGGGGGTPVTIPSDNNPCVLVFRQPNIYTDNSIMIDPPPKEISSYRLYAAPYFGGSCGPMEWVAEINNPLSWENNEWIGYWDIRHLIGDNNSVLYGVSANGTVALSLKAVSTRLDNNGVPYISAFAVPWVYSTPPIVLDNITNLQEGDIHAPSILRSIRMQLGDVGEWDQ